MYMYFYGVRDRVKQNNLREGSNNLTDYFTKHHFLVHHKNPKYLRT